MGKTSNNTESNDVLPDNVSPEKTEKKWTSSNYKTATPNCNTYCTKIQKRCTVLSFSPLTYGCKERLSTEEPKTKEKGTPKTAQKKNVEKEEKSWTLLNYKTKPTCSDYCEKINQRCTLIDVLPKYFIQYFKIL